MCLHPRRAQMTLSSQPSQASRILHGIYYMLAAVLLFSCMDALIKAAAGRGIAMEINANSWRLDLRDTHARAALEAGVKLAINTDAHGPSDLGQLEFGVLTAQRAGARKEDVVNCMSKSALAKWITSTRA